MIEGKLFVVGIGPGSLEDMTIRAHRALENCDVIAGYTVYCDLVRPHFQDKEYISTPMMREEERVKLALEKAASGNRVCLVCSGDAGVYGLAGLAVSMGQDFEGDQIDVEIIPGVTAAISGAALLGAPLIHDFCLVSLSDRLTPWELIEKRLLSAAEADMTIVLYNPESKSRAGYLKKACDILLKTCDGNRVCGVAGEIGRDGEKYQVMTLTELRDYQADMFTTVFIGSAGTRRVGDKMVTPRGYESEK
ncbi:precorrin-3B C(17)-methyltransferase [Butyrivibrio sp. CB08]|uniref:precorrin-3B C(17)-methyltransferase n=1 Tax=Butyrivibrio sp. CB08 TaxID=2364879 RepID=UPI000EA84C8E|nr:precorrin-3B C(17)-methyltransferase [Butyrivibrio sp. CB08]RKM59756.1 precorrin-3B C(17)-methyltransferase [Butyrivibrio sp. CB08]